MASDPQAPGPNATPLLSLTQLLDDLPLPGLAVEVFLALALAVTKVLQTLHQQIQVHGALQPASIFWAGNLAATPPVFQVQIFEPEGAVGQPLAYRAPEQTGRLNRPVDQRTDFYTLGVIFYQLLTRRLPFAAREPQALIYAHLATPPPSPAQMRPALPPGLVDLVLKLLAKDPADRYQSAAGLWADLHQCHTAWQAAGHIPAFALGTADFAPQLLLPEKLYGRAPERQQLTQALAEAQAGHARLLLLTGASGVGKTALVGALWPQVFAAHGTLLTRRAKMSEANTPHAGAVGLLAEFVQQLLTRDAAQVAQWQTWLATALAGNTAPLLQQIPALGLLLPALAERRAETSDPQRLLNLALQNCFHCLVEAEPLLVIFVDEAHHADSASLQLLHSLTQPQPRRVLVILAYREDVPLPEALPHLQATVAPADQLRLAPLTLAHTTAFLAETFHTAPAEVAELAQLLQAKTEGNPFFLRELLGVLQARGLLVFDQAQHAWRWTLAQIQAAPLADKVGELVRERLARLPGPAQKTLKIAALLGQRFEFAWLVQACDRPAPALAQDLRHARRLGAIVLLPPGDLVFAAPTDLRLATLQQIATQYFAGPPPPAAKPLPAALAPPPTPCYQFAHEQVWAAAQQLQPTLTEAALHWQIGWHLWHALPPEQRAENLFMIVHHLNQPLAGPATAPERWVVAQANEQASRRALAFAAHENALTFALHGLAQLTADPSGPHPSPALRRTLQLHAVQAAARLGRFAEAEALLTTLAAEADTVFARVAVTQERMLALYFQGQHEAALSAALQALHELGVHLPPQPGKLHLALALGRAQLTLGPKPLERLAALPPMRDEQRQRAMEIMAAATISAATVNPTLLLVLGLEMLQQTLRYGAHALSALGYALYGVLLCGTGQIARGYALGQRALQLAPQIEIKEYRVFVRYFVHAHVQHWQDHIQATLQPLRELATTGEFEYFAVAAGLYPYFTWFISGMDVPTSARVMADNMYLLAPFKDTPLHYRYQLGLQYYQNLLGQAATPSQLVGAVYDERVLLPRHLAENDHTTIFYWACHKLTLGYLFGDYAQAQQAAQLAHAHQAGGMGTPLVPVLAFYEALTGLALYPSATGRAARQLWQSVVANQRQLQHWAQHSPANCRHRHTLVAAIQAQVLGQPGPARELFDAAIQQAQAQHYLPELAVAQEAAARFYLSRGQAAYAEHHLRQAHHHYQAWGALGKCQQLARQFPPSGSSAPVEKNGDWARLSEQLDLASVFKATQALARETALPQLLETLTTLLIENAGAQSGCLLLPEGAQWRGAGHPPPAPATTPTRVALSLVWQVARTREPLLLNDVAAALAHDYAAYAPDPHLQAARPRSILCLPLLEKGELLGVFYMENCLTRDAFPPARLPVLTLLANQAAIALKNATLVAGLQAAQARLQASDQRFRLLFDSAPVGIFEIDLAMGLPQIRAANQRAEALYGWAASALVQHDLAQLMPEASRPELARLIETVRAGKTALRESLHARRDGSLFPVRLIATPAPGPQGLHMIVVVEDITAQRQRRSEIAAIEEERQRIAQEIHDGVAQNLAFLRLKLALWRDWVHAAPALMPRELDQAEATLDATLQEIRRSIYALRPVALDTLGLLPALRRYVADFNEQHEVSVALQIDPTAEHLPSGLELLVFRVVQEALNNIAQHAQASLAWVRLGVVALALHVTIRDNGRGFAVAQQPPPGATGHLGLLQMRERITQAHGHLTVTSQPEQGTEIAVVLPLSELV